MRETSFTIVRRAGLAAALAGLMVAPAALPSPAQTAPEPRAAAWHVLDANPAAAMTPEALRRATQGAAPMRHVRQDAPPPETILDRLAAMPAITDEPVLHPGHPGPRDRTRDRTAQRNLRAAEAVTPENYGQGNRNTIYHFNDYLREPYPVRLYPWRAAGKLFVATAGGGWITCTATMIAPAILVTVGHCLHTGGTGNDGWLVGGFFVPAHTDRVFPFGPYGYCNLQYATVTDDWLHEGALGQGYDVGLAVCNRRITNDGILTNRLMGNVTGWLGFCVRNCRQNYWYFTRLGYPGNYYNGDEMIVSQSLAHAPEADFMHGTGMLGGASGGPHISNIGRIEDSAANLGEWTLRNYVFAVSSWDYGSAIKIQGASPLSGLDNANRFKVLYNRACRFSREAHGPRSCTPL